ncbi:MAG: sigma-70 family RNA polymerase sigma factor [Clostridia bacterium]|nr:sigma-70 family RNA polymerase sigma factor [Clostridia bacterium]
MLQFLFTLTDESNHGKVEHIYYTYHEYMMKCAVSKFQSMGRTNALYDAEDAVQATFMKITKYINAIDFSRGEKDVKNYCFAILSNEILNVLSDNQEDFEFDEEFCSEIEYNFIEELEIKERYDEVVKAIEALDERYSTTLYLALCKEMTPNEIANIMGLTVKTVYTRLARGRKLLLESLKGANFNG